MNYGYRVFTISLLKGYGRTAKLFTSESLYLDGGTAVDDILRISKENINKNYFHPLKHKRYMPDDLTELDPEEDKALTMLSAKQVQSYLIFEFRWGKSGSHDKALSRSSNDVPLGNEAAPSNRFRAILYLPKENAKTGILAVETIGRLNVASDFVKYISCLFEDYSESQPDRPGWWNFRIRPAADINRLERQLQEGIIEEVKLKVKSVSQEGRRRETEKTYTQRKFTVEQERNTKDTARRWLRNIIQSEKEDSADIRDVVAYIAPEIENIEWNDGSITFRTEDNQKKTVSPDDMSAVFQYRLGTRRPTDREFFDATYSMALDLQKPLRLELDL